MWAHVVRSLNGITIMSNRLVAREDPLQQMTSANGGPNSGLGVSDTNLICRRGVLKKIFELGKIFLSRNSYDFVREKSNINIA